MYSFKCTMQGCEKEHHCKGLCSMHYKRLQRHGDPSIVKINLHGGICSKEGCESKYFAKGRCSKHYYQDYRRVK